MIQEWPNMLLILALVIMRPLGIILLLPAFNILSQGGMLIRNTLTLTLSLPLLPSLLERYAAYTPSNLWNWVACCIIEFIVGSLIGLSVAFPFWAVDMAGTLIDTLRGASLSNVLNPLLAAESSLFGGLFSLIYTVGFFSLGGCEALLSGFYQSYQKIPIGQFLWLHPHFVRFVAQQWHTMFELCLSFSLPAIVVMVLIDGAFGFLNRLAQQLNVFFLSMPIKSLFVLFILVITLSSILNKLFTGLEKLPAGLNWVIAGECYE